MSNTLGAYIDFIRIRFLTMLAYRVNYYSGILIYTLNIGVYYFTWKAIYGGGGELGGFTASQMTTYLAVSWMARAFLFQQSRPGNLHGYPRRQHRHPVYPPL